MVASPTPRTWVDGEIPSSNDLNQALYEVWQFLLNPPMVRARQSSNQTLSTDTWTAITFGVEDIDTHGFHDTSANTTKFIPTVPGYYVGAYGVSFGQSSAGRRLSALMKNGTDKIWRTDTQAPTVGTFAVKGNAFGPVYMNGTTDYLEVYAYQTTGGNLTTDAGDGGSTDYEMQPDFYMRWWSA